METKVLKGKKKIFARPNIDSNISNPKVLWIYGCTSKKAHYRASNEKQSFEGGRFGG